MNHSDHMHPADDINFGDNSIMIDPGQKERKDLEAPLLVGPDDLPVLVGPDDSILDQSITIVPTEEIPGLPELVRHRRHSRSSGN